MTSQEQQPRTRTAPRSQPPVPPEKPLPLLPGNREQLTSLLTPIAAPYRGPIAGSLADDPAYGVSAFLDGLR